ncbi:phage tail domain-containing protein [Kitasatospora sp. NPDC059646]|uniref:phage tail domain-containing protein n=1 Tax=Kitasatospora sp. NPDC059646 TaxID=3346893 RepID=UPI0036996D7F
MPIPAVKRLVDGSQPPPRPGPPQRVHWQHTYASITGSNGEGEEIPLTGYSGNRWPAIFMQDGATGLDTPPYELHADDSPNLDGGLFRGVRATQREIMIPVYIYGIDRRTLLEQKRELARALNPKNGYCVLKFTESDGQARYLNAYYKGGMEGNESSDQSGFRWIKYALLLTAYDPWFYSDEMRVAKWSFGQGVPFLGRPFLPLRLSEGYKSAVTLPVYNPGDVEAWPVWEISGPVKSFRITSQTGQKFGIPSATSGGDVIALGRTLRIDTRPGVKTLKDDRGTNYYPDMEADPKLWSIPSGDSTMTVDVVAGSGQATVTLTFKPRYDSY